MEKRSVRIHSPEFQIPKNKKVRACKVMFLGSTQILPALWATGGLEVISIQYPSPYPLPGPPIWQVWITRGFISFSPPQEMPSESSNKSKAHKVILFSSCIFPKHTMWEPDCVSSYFSRFFSFAPLNAAGHHRPSLSLATYLHSQARAR